VGELCIGATYVYQPLAWWFEMGLMCQVCFDDVAVNIARGKIEGGGSTTEGAIYLCQPCTDTAFARINKRREHMNRPIQATDPDYPSICYHRVGQRSPYHRGLVTIHVLCGFEPKRERGA